MRTLLNNVSKAFVRVVALQQRVQHYRDLGGFVVLMALFITILYLQADSSRSYEITSAHAVLFPPVCSLHAFLLLASALYPPDASNTFNGPDDFYSWLNTSIVQVRSSAARLCIIAPPAPAVCWPLLRTSKPAPPARLPMPMPHHTSLLPASRPARTRTARPLVSPTSLPLPLFLPHLQTLWADPTCGDGSCDRPFQFPAFGRFGCEADCGTFPNLTSVIIRFSSHLDTQQAADESSWNLCMVDPVSLCWYARPLFACSVLLPLSALLAVRGIPAISAWRVRSVSGVGHSGRRLGGGAHRAAGGIRGTVHAPPPGTRRLSVVGAASSIELVAWGSCSLDDGLASTNQTQPGGSAAGASPDICRDVSMPLLLCYRCGRSSNLFWRLPKMSLCMLLTCARLVVCLPATCGRAFTEREVAGAFVDCARMCIVAPSSITSYANASCPTPDIASLFANTPCNVSDALLSLSVAVCPLDMSLALPASACRSLPLRAAPCLCVPAPCLWCRSLPLRAAPCLCVPLPASACRSLPLRAAPCLCVPLPASACRSLPLRAAPCLCVPFPASVCRSLPLCAAPCLCVPLPASADTFRHGPGANRKHSQGGPGSLRWNMVACFCTMLGGPVTTLDECRLTDTAGRQVLSISDMYVYLRSTHVRGGRVISAQHMRRFVQTVAAALRSVTLISDAAAARLNTLMHSFDDAIATSDAVGCSQGGAWLPWRAGVKHNTTIHVGDKVTWVWDDDLPHSLKVAAMGEAEDPLFLGFGGEPSGRVAPADMHAHERMDDESPGSFAYSKVFYEPLTIHYEDGTLSLDDSSSSSDVSLLTVLPARAGAEVAVSVPYCMPLCFLPLFHPHHSIFLHSPQPARIASIPRRHPSRACNACMAGGVHATDSSTLSSTAHFTTARTITPSTTTTSSSSPSSFPLLLFLPLCLHRHRAAAAAATYECSPGCRLRRLANGGVRCGVQHAGRVVYPRRWEPISTSPSHLQRYGPNYTESNHAFAAERGIAVNRYVSRHNRYGPFADRHGAAAGSVGHAALQRIGVSAFGGWGDSLTFVLTTVTCKVNAGGAMAVSFKSQPAAMAMYDASADNIARLVLEMVYLGGGCSGMVVLWRYVEAFDMQPRYDIYYTLLEMPRYWAVPNPPTGFISAAQAFADLRNIINLRAVYFAHPGHQSLFHDDTPPQGDGLPALPWVITRSLSVATPSLLHFFLLSFTVFFCFSMYGYLVFGGALEMFSSVLESMFSCFLLLLNDNSSAYFFQRLESWDLIAAMLFFFMFIVFMVFILLNFLIAIIVDAFMNVKDSNIIATSITSDLAHIFKYKWNCWRGRYLPYRVILERLVKLGAKGHPSGRVREKRIDAISLAMILQRRQDRERHEPHEHELLPTCWPKAASSETAEEEQLEQLSQAVMLQCGEVVKQSALPVKKPVQKLSLAHIKEDLVRSEAAVKELRGMLALVLDHLARTHPLEDAAHAMATGASGKQEGGATKVQRYRGKVRTFQPFPRGETETTVAFGHSGRRLGGGAQRARGGIRGTVHAPPPGTRRFSVVGAASTIELAAWGYCALDDGTVAANQTGPSGGAAGASPDICRDTCEKLVVCLPATCGRAFTERSWTVRACASSHLLPSPPMPTLPAPGASLPPCLLSLPHVAVSHAALLILSASSLRALHSAVCVSSQLRLNGQRLTVLQVAVSRALFTVAKDRCLAGHGGSKQEALTGGARQLALAHGWRGFCTMLGGPVMTMDECRLTDTEGQQAQHMRRFVLTVGAALSSVTLISDAAAARLNLAHCTPSMMPSSPPTLSAALKVGAHGRGAWLRWRSGVTHNTTIHVGDKVTWVWDDDLPHSLKVAAMGEADDPLFLGFGGHRLGVSRKLACTHMKMDDESPGFFSYSKVFEEPITIHYEDGTLSVDDSSSSSASSPSSASLLTVLPARAGAEVADVANATNSSTLSSTARFTDTNATTPSATSAPYQCSPGCRLRRLANGVCDAACNTPACAFDGGDCACVDPLFGPGICACPPGHTRHDDGSCCLSTAVGANLNFPFSLQRYGPATPRANFAFAAERGFPVKRYSANRHGAAAGSVGDKAVQWIGASLTTLPLVFDINLDYEAAMRRLHYLVDGGYIDNGTRTVDVSFITFNGETLTFVLTTVRCTLNAGGSMAVTFRSQPAAMAMYDASADNIARLVLEVVYLVGLLWNVCGELQEMADRAAVDPRYDIYYTLLEMPRYWAVPNPPTGFISATQAFAELRNIINLRGIYFALQGINEALALSARGSNEPSSLKGHQSLLHDDSPTKVMDFQPYLGVITRSLALATPSLLHFFLLSFAVFFCFSMYGYLVFGGALEMFSTVLESIEVSPHRLSCCPNVGQVQAQMRVWTRSSWSKLSQAAVLQCGEVVKQAALPVKKPVQKLSLAHIKVGKEGGDR
ncbi:unnamed protein product, partial [Closterium sp. NIES-64]